jgi:hypothetical protein
LNTGFFVKANMPHRAGIPSSRPGAGRLRPIYPKRAEYESPSTLAGCLAKKILGFFKPWRGPDLSRKLLCCIDILSKIVW